MAIVHINLVTIHNKRFLLPNFGLLLIAVFRRPNLVKIFDEAVWFSGDLSILIAELLIKHCHHVPLNKIHFALEYLSNDWDNVLAHHARIKGELGSWVLHKGLEEIEVAISEICAYAFVVFKTLNVSILTNIRIDLIL